MFWKSKVLNHLNESFVKHMIRYVVDEIQCVVTHHPLLKFDDEFYDNQLSHWVFMPPQTQKCMAFFAQWRVARLLIDIHAEILSIPLEMFGIDIDSWLKCMFRFYCILGYVSIHCNILMGLFLFQLVPVKHEMVFKTTISNGLYL